MILIYTYILTELSWVRNCELVSHIDWISSLSFNLQDWYYVRHSELGCLYIILETNWFGPSCNFCAMSYFNLSNVISLVTLMTTTSLHVNVTPSSLLIMSPFAYIAIRFCIWLIIFPIMQCNQNMLKVSKHNYLIYLIHFNSLNHFLKSYMNYANLFHIKLLIFYDIYYTNIQSNNYHKMLQRDQKMVYTALQQYNRIKHNSEIERIINSNGTNNSEGLQLINLY